MKTGVRAGKKFNTVHQYMKSLEEYGLAKYRAYSPNEINLVLPNREKVVRDPHTDKFTKLVFGPPKTDNQ